MMMLPSLLDVAALAVSAFSPSKTCKVRVSSTRYRNDPYLARVLPRHISSVVSAPIQAPVEPMTPLQIVNALSMLPSASAPTAPPSPVKMAPVIDISTIPVKQAPKQHFAVVGFKHDTMMYQAPFRVSPGDVVIVEADRGEHIGVVQEVTTDVPKFNVPSRIVRRATRAEYAAHEATIAKESVATKAIQKLSESLGLGIKIVDTEFQMDGNKLTVFFSSKVFVDFRKLQRSLFRDYRCRIWLVNWAQVRAYESVPVNSI